MSLLGPRSGMKTTVFHCISKFSYSFLVIVLTLHHAVSLPSVEFKSGQFYTITSAASGKAMTVAGKEFKHEADIITSSWIAQDNQLWLALGESTLNGKPISNPEKFILLPQRQSWDWKRFLETGRINATIGSLPDDTVVLTLDTNVVNLTQSLLNGSSNQKWVTEEAGDGYVLIKNWGNQQCIKNFDFKQLNLLERVRKRIDTFFGISRRRKASPLGTLACNSGDVSERWMLEPVLYWLPTMASTDPSKLFHAVETEAIHSVTNFLNEATQTTDLISLKNIIDSRNEQNQTALHISCSKLVYNIAQILLEAGSDPNVQDVDGRTPAFLVIVRLQECNCEDCMKKAIRCLTILSYHGGSMDIPDANGITPLYLSAEYRFTDCAKSLLENGAALGTAKGRPMIEILVEKVPSVLETVFDRAVKIVGSHSVHDPDFEMKFDLSIILPPQITLNHQLHHSNGNINQVFPAEQWFGENYEASEEMLFLKQLLENSERDATTYKSLLRHPLVNVFTDMKWKSLESLYIFFLVMQIKLLLAYSAFICATIFLDCPYDLYIKIQQGLDKINTQAFANKGTFNVTDLIDPERLCEIGIISKVLSIFVVICTTMIMLKEVQHALYDIKDYLKDIFNYFQLVGFLSVIFTVIVAWDHTSPLYSFLYPISAFGIVVSWCQIFTQIGRLPQLAIYVEMFVKISVNFCLSLTIYSFLFIGFAMSYSILFPVKPRLWDLPLSLIKVLTMLIGELDYENLFKNDDDEKSSKQGEASGEGVNKKYTFAGHVWYVTFVVFVTLILMNLLVGLAVSDIQGIRKHAEIYVIKRRIRYIAYLEKVLYEVTTFIPNVMKNFLRENVAIARPTKPTKNFLCCFNFFCPPVDLVNCKLTVHPNKSKDRFLSNESKMSIRHWCLSKSVSNIARKCQRLHSETQTGFRQRSLANFRKGSTTSFVGVGQQIFSKDTSILSDTERLKRLEFNVQQMDKKINEVDLKLDLIVKTLTRPETPTADL